MHRTKKEPLTVMLQVFFRPITARRAVVLSNSVFRLSPKTCCPPLLLCLSHPPCARLHSCAARSTTYLLGPDLVQRPVMRSSPGRNELDSHEPRTRRCTSHGAPTIAPDGSFIVPLAPASPPSRSISHTPPLPPTTSSSLQSSQRGVDPLAEFSKDESNFAATDRCLDAACSLLQFEIAEVCVW